MEICESSALERERIAEGIVLHSGLSRLQTQVELGGKFKGYDTVYQGGFSYFESRGKQISIWRDDEKAMLAMITINYPFRNHYGYIQTISDFKISYDGSQVSHIQTWPYGNPDDIGSDLPYRTEELGMGSCDKLKLTIAELDEARKKRETSFLGRFVAKFSRLF